MNDSTLLLRTGDRSGGDGNGFDRETGFTAKLLHREDAKERPREAREERRDRWCSPSSQRKLGSRLGGQTHVRHAFWLKMDPSFRWDDGKTTQIPPSFARFAWSFLRVFAVKAVRCWNRGCFAYLAALRWLPRTRRTAGGVTNRWMAVPTPGIRYMAYGAFWFSVMSLLVKVAGQRLPAMEIVFVRGVISLVLSWFLVRRAGLRIWGANPPRLLVRGMVGFAGLACFYYAVIHLPLAEATVIQYTNPVFTALLAAFLLRERLGWLEGICVSVSLAGVLLIARPGFLFGSGSALPPLVVGIAVAGAVFSAGAYVSVRWLSSSEHPLVIVFYFPLVTVPATLPFLALGAVWPRGWEWPVLLGIGVTTQIAQVYMTKGLQLVPAGRATAIGYTQIVFAATWGAAFFAEIPDVWSLGGAALIIVSSLALAWWRNGKDEG